MNPLGGAITIGLCLAVWITVRHWAALAILAGVCYLTQGQEIEVGFHFTAIRIVLLAGLIRVVARGELRQIRVNAIDRALATYALCLVFIATIRVGTTDELVYQLGVLYNICLSYFVFRALLKEASDIHRALNLLAIAIIPFALLMIRESIVGTNPFAVFGGVSETSLVRDGHVRSQGSFRQAITAGAFGSTMALFFVSMAFVGVKRRVALVGFIAAFVIVICAHSSGPLLGLMLGMVSLASWKIRSHMRAVRWSIVIALISLHFVMKAPVWFLLARIGDLIGGGGYHRAYLIDRFVSDFDSWWLLGTSDTADWFPYQLHFGSADITNQFVSDGINAGLIGLILSVVLMVRCFQSVGLAIQRARGKDPSGEKFLWGIGSTLVGSIGILFSVTYFDQMHVVWYFFLACIAAAAENPLRHDNPRHESRIEIHHFL